jgi:hypothetical protein
MPLPTSLNVKNILGGKTKNQTSEASLLSSLSSSSSPIKPSHPFNFEDGSYQYPNLAEECLEMLQVSMLIYSITDLRSLAKHPKKSKLIKEPERILTLPLSLTTCLELLEENYDVVKVEFGDDQHANTINSLQSIHARYHQLHNPNNSYSNNNINYDSSCNAATANIFTQWLNPIFSALGTDQGMEVQALPCSNSFSTAAAAVTATSPVPLLTAYGDDNSESDMVYAVGVDPIRKRVTVAFRGSVTSTDFIKDASITMNHQPNPIKTTIYPDHPYDTIGIHQGFFDYLLKQRHAKNSTQNKFEEIFQHVRTLFEEQPERQSTYKLYVTGHSLGGALATLFSLYVACSASFVAGTKEKSSNATNGTIIPAPVSCISVASPRVGDRNFQAAFAHLEEQGLLRHVRIANDRDPVTVMPGASGKKIWATLSPVSYLAFKLMDRQFEEKEKFRHTGIKLLLTKDEFEFYYAGNPVEIMDQTVDQKGSHEDVNDDASSPAVSNSVHRGTVRASNSKRKEKIPDVAFHLGKAYTDNLASVASALSTLSLNDLYRIHVAAIVAKKGMVEEGEQS